jgi:hypothetical protein
LTACPTILGVFEMSSANQIEGNEVPSPANVPSPETVEDVVVGQVDDAESRARKAVEERAPSRARLEARAARKTPCDPWLDDEYDWEL